MAAPKLNYDCWDAKYNRPIVDGKVTNPSTGAIESAGPMLVAGPPSISASWFNVANNPTWRSLHAPVNCPIDDLLCAIAVHIKEGLYSIDSLNASAYSLTVVVKSVGPQEEFRKKIREMRERLD
jgi:hypothetical protein